MQQTETEPSNLELVNGEKIEKRQVMNWKRRWLEKSCSQLSPNMQTKSQIDTGWKKGVSKPKIYKIMQCRDKILNWTEMK